MRDTQLFVTMSLRRDNHDFLLLDSADAEEGRKGEVEEEWRDSLKSWFLTGYALWVG